MNTKFTFRSGLAAILTVLCGGFAMAQKPVNVVIIGGGSSHVWTWNYKTDSATLVAGGFATVKYVGTRRDRIQSPFNPDSSSTKEILAAIPQADVLYITTNNQFNDPRLHEALMKHVNAGKGLVFGHAGGWHNHNPKQKQGLPRGTTDPTYEGWPEYNRIFLSGGTRGHDRPGPYQVVVTNTKHQIMQGVTRTTFPVTDELYYMTADTSKAALGWTVLATATSPVDARVFPQVVAINHPKAKIVNITLGHDGLSHDVPEFQTILRNSVAYAAGKKNPKK
jgi:type 1 glutamine amidotransferase